MDKEMPIKKDIIYPIFLECCQYATDEYWKNIFEDLAYGITPSGTYISKGNLCCNYKKKHFSYPIEQKKSLVLYNEVYTHLTEKMGLLSQKDRIEKRNEISKIRLDLEESRNIWANIRKKNIREALIQMYVTSKSKEYNLTLKQSRYLLSVIFIAMVFKSITAKDINYIDGGIKNIKGIEFTNKQIILDHNIYGKDTTFSPQIIITQKPMSDTWEKYTSNLRKIISKK